MMFRIKTRLITFRIQKTSGATMVTFGMLGFLAAVVVQVSAEVPAICYEGCRCTLTSDSTAGIINCTSASLYGIPQGLPAGVYMLIINNDEIPTIKKNSFNYPSASEMHILSLQRNGIVALEADAFVDLTELDSLDLSQNSITILGPNIFRGLYHVITLGLIDNKISTIDDKAFEGLWILTSLYLSGNNIRSLIPDVFRHSPKLHELSLSDNFQLLLPADKPFLKSTSLRILNISYCDLEELPTMAFQGTPNLEQIDLANNYLTHGLHSFRNLSNLAVLNLEENCIETLEPNVFEDLQNLKILRLNGNKIRTLRPNTFRGNSNLALLALNSNELSIIDKALFLPLIHLTELDLSSNHLTCDCRLQTVYIWCLRQNVSTEGECESIHGFTQLSWASLGELNCTGESSVLPNNNEYSTSTVTPSSDLREDTLRVSSLNMYILIVVCPLVFILLGMFFAYARRRYKESSTSTAYDVSAASQAGGTYNNFPMGEVTSVIINSIQQP
jgi:Leucine-rich repeat (LRR) protein